jgi:5'-nucleotidase
MAVNAILDKHEQPDLVISGINHGPNLGMDILYSGTVSCAMEGAMLGIPSIAVSLATMRQETEHFVTTAKFILKLIPRLGKFNFPSKTILNVNTPALDESDIAGVEITKLGTKMFTDDYEKRVDPRGKVYYWMAGELTKEHEEDGTDIAALRANRVSITPITFEMTHTSVMESLEEAFCAGKVCDWFGYGAKS